MVAGDIILRHYNPSLKVNEKSDGSLVTAADIEANAYISAQLSSLDPSIPIISEETEIPSFKTRQNWSRFWLVDPLDGTSEFANHLDDFTVNIALIEQNVPVLGVIFAPAKNLLYWAEKSYGAWKKVGASQAQRIYSAEPNKVGPLVVACSRRHGVGELEEYLKDLVVEKMLSVGSSLKFCMVAEGTADIYPRFGTTMEWDVAAGDCIYRNSAPTGFRTTTLTYNKEDLRNDHFVIGR